jgi:hypothetical protein
MSIRINILVLVWIIVCATFLAHKAFGADTLIMEKKPPAPKVVCVGYYDKAGELLVEICPAPSGLESEPERILKGE